MVSTTDIDPKMLDCPALLTIKLVSGKWKTRILWHLRHGSAGFGDLQGALSGISAKVLTDHLAALVADDILTRDQQVQNNVVHSVYAYSDYGLSLVPVLDALGNWGVYHASRAAVPR